MSAAATSARAPVPSSRTTTRSGTRCPGSPSSRGSARSGTRSIECRHVAGGRRDLEPDGGASVGVPTIRVDPPGGRGTPRRRRTTAATCGYRPTPRCPGCTVSRRRSSTIRGCRSGRDRRRRRPSWSGDRSGSVEPRHVESRRGGVGREVGHRGFRGRDRTRGLGAGPHTTAGGLTTYEAAEEADHVVETDAALLVARSVGRGRGTIRRRTLRGSRRGRPQVLKKLWFAPYATTTDFAEASPGTRYRASSKKSIPWRSETSPSQNGRISRGARR